MTRIDRHAFTLAIGFLFVAIMAYSTITGLERQRVCAPTKNAALCELAFMAGEPAPIAIAQGNK